MNIEDKYLNEGNSNYKLNDLLDELIETANDIQSYKPTAVERTDRAVLRRYFLELENTVEDIKQLLR